MIFLYLRGLFPTITFYGRSKALKIRKMNILLHIAQKQHKKQNIQSLYLSRLSHVPLSRFVTFRRELGGVLTLYAGNSRSSSRLDTRGAFRDWLYP